MYCCSVKLPFFKVMTSLMVLVFGFLLGISSHIVFARLKPTTKAPVNSAYARRIDEWHRLYEAAGMTGDSEIMKEIHDRLRCTNISGETVGILVETDTQIGCKTDHSDSLQELSFVAGSEYGSFLQTISDSHLKWSLQNLEFLRSISSVEKARKYVQEHRWPR